MHSIGILQGRLSPDPEGRFQFFPEIWQEEFVVAKQLGFDGIEWLVDPKDPYGWEKNPIFEEQNEIQRSSKKWNIPVTSICADWFMDICLWEGDPCTHREMLLNLIPSASNTKNKLILIPFLEKHNIIDHELRTKTLNILKPIRGVLEMWGVSIGFETELPVHELVGFIDSFESPYFGAYYDIGNCTSYGFNCAQDIKILSHRIKGVHVKDRKRGSSQSLPLGEGDADFSAILCALHEIAWNGTLIMQAWRGEKYLEDAKKQLGFLKNKLREVA